MLAMTGVFYDIVRCRLAVAEVPVLILRFQSRFTHARAARGAAMPGGPREPQLAQRCERRLEFRERAGASSDESERTQSQPRRVPQFDLRRAIRPISQPR